MSKNKSLEELLTDYCKRNVQIAWIILLVCLGFAAFLVCYPKYSMIGFVLMVLFCSAGFFIFTKLPDERSEWLIETDRSLIERIRTLYSKERSDYIKTKKIFIILLVIFDLLVPITSSILYFIYDNILLINYPLALSLIISGIVIFIWLRRSTRLEAMRKLMNMREN